MLVYENVALLGTSHIAKSSIKEIKKAIVEEDPDLVAVELDQRRLYALMHQGKHKASIADIRHIGLTGYIFTQIGGWVQKKLGRSVGVKPGSDMLTAIKEAHKRKIPVALIDQDIEITLRKFTKRLTRKEKWQFVKDIVRGFLFKEREIKRLGVTHLDLSKVPEREIIIKLTAELKKKYPNVYDVLIKERNEIMAKKVASLMKNYVKVLVVVGAGHEEEMVRLIKHYKNKVERVKGVDYEINSV